jgi:predicted nucleic acid-binding protein
MNDPDRRPGFLDAIHLATARVLALALEALVTYDDRLVKTAWPLSSPRHDPHRISPASP